MIKHEGLRKVIESAFTSGLYVYREHMGAICGYEGHVTRLIIVDLEGEYNDEYIVKTSDVEQQISLIQLAIDNK